MRHSDFCKKYIELKNLEQEELKKAVLAHGGEFRFKTEDGKDIEGVYAPVITVGDGDFEPNCYCYVTRVVVNGNSIEIYGHNTDRYNGEKLFNDIDIGFIPYIIDSIPETDKIQDVTTKPPVYEVPIVSLCRDDIADAGYNPDITDDELQQVASRISKYLEWQDFWPQFLEDVREACDNSGLDTLGDTDSK